MGYGIASYTWSTGATTQSITVTPAEATTYTVTVTNAEGCEATASVEVVLGAGPVVTIEGDNITCAATMVTLAAVTEETVSYLWSTGEVTPTINVTPAETTTYEVTVTSIYGCSSTTSFELIVRALPEVSIDGNTEICLGEATDLTAMGGQYANYLWSNGEITESITVMPEVTTEYTVSVVDLNGCTNSATIVVTVNNVEELYIMGETEICLGTSTTLSVVSSESIVSYLWSNGEITSSIEVEPAGTTTYSVTVVAENGCVLTREIEVEVRDCTREPIVIEIYPVPADEYITIVCDDIDRVSLISSDGHLVMWAEGDGADSMQLRVKDLAAGPYVLYCKVTDGRGIAKKIIIHHAFQSLIY